MDLSSNGPKKSVLHMILPYTTVLVILTALYAGWTFYSRWRENRDSETEAAQKQAAANQRIVDTVFGSGDVKLLSFSATSAIHRGEQANMCYGVSNAVSVVIEPHVEDSKPSFNHCLQLSPSKTTSYTLTAKDAKGHVASGTVTIHVQ